jgi:hypothetical protein
MNAPKTFISAKIFLTLKFRISIYGCNDNQHLIACSIDTPVTTSTATSVLSNLEIRHNNAVKCHKTTLILLNGKTASSYTFHVTIMNSKECAITSLGILIFSMLRFSI